ncbi:epoxyqueuosine reductase [Lacunimicrobium album]
MVASSEITTQLKSYARSLGFSLVGIACAEKADTYGEFRDWLEQQFHGSMGYMQRRADAYQSPAGVMPDSVSVVMLGVNYDNLAEQNVETGQGKIARYARGGHDYHDILRDKLYLLAQELKRLVPGCRTRGTVDTAPLLERDFARKAGLGWIGKNTMLINKHQGSYLFLASLLTDVELVVDTPHETSHCGSCTRCLQACPTDAFVTPYVLDARRCISYLTIEQRHEPTDESLRPYLSDWIFGCDICQEVCPWNRRNLVASMTEFKAREDLEQLDLVVLLNMSEEIFHERFKNTPMMRPGRAALLRNAAMVAGNQKLVTALPALSALTADEHESELLREAATWAIEQINSATQVSQWVL